VAFYSTRGLGLILNSRNGGRWTESRYRSFIISALRSASQRWGPKNDCLKEARLERGIYLCKGYGRKAHKVTASIKVKNKRARNVFADHIEPVIEPATGFIDWNTFISRLFTERNNYQCLCLSCHQTKSADERELRKSK
jgi:hypothetical protein